jgi:hypothetical protein
MDEEVRQRLQVVLAVLAELIEVQILTVTTLQGLLADLATKVPLKSQVASDLHTAQELWPALVRTLQAQRVQLSQIRL